MAELNFVDEIEATVSKEVILLFTDEPSLAVKLRNSLRMDMPDSVVMIRDARFFKGENDIEKCDKAVFLNATNRDLIISTYRQCGERFKVADVPVSEQGEPEGPVVDNTPIDDTALDLGETMGLNIAVTGLPGGEVNTGPIDVAYIGPEDLGNLDGLAGVPGEDDGAGSVDLTSLSDEELKTEYQNVFGKNPHHLKSRDTIIKELTAGPEAEA